MDAKIREDFPILSQAIHGHPLAYLDNAATTHKPRAVIAAVRDFYENANSNVHRGIHELSNRATDIYENARKRTARFLNAQSHEEIIFTRGTTESVNLLASAWGSANLKKGDVILLTEMEHHSNLIPWQIIARQTGAKLTFIPVNIETGQLELDTLPKLLKKAKILAFTHISNTLGTINPAQELCTQARQHGVTTFIDAAQSAGHMPVDVQKIGCDFLAFSGHKTCAPTGIGVLYGRKELLEKLSPYHGGGEMIASAEYETFTPKPPPHRFEAGTPNIAGAAGLHAALDYLDNLGREKIFTHDQQLARAAFEKLSSLEGLRILGNSKDRAGVISFEMGDIHAHDIVTLADREGVALRGGHHCNQPLMRKMGLRSTARASFYFYNTEAEIDRLAETLHNIRKFFSRGH